MSVVGKITSSVLHVGILIRSQSTQLPKRHVETWAWGKVSTGGVDLGVTSLVEEK